jgi:hypothetical protein
MLNSRFAVVSLLVYEEGEHEEGVGFLFLSCGFDI